MRSQRHTLQDEDTGIDLAPMLDFVLNLLIFFIITTTFVKEAGIQVSRPEAETASHQEKGNILIAIRPNGEVWMDKHALDLRDLRTAIERAHAERPEDGAVVIADKKAPTGVLQDVMDQIKQGGIDDISVAAAPPK